MLETLSKKSILIGSLALTSIMFGIVMFIINPLIDGNHGFGVIQLQLSFNTDAGIEIINSWGTSGKEIFNQWIFTDYIYAFAYSLFFASLLSMLILKKGKDKSLAYTWIVYLAFVAGFFDWIENTIELLFINNTSDFPNSIFLLHSIVATLKWAVVPIAVTYIVALLIKENKANA